MITLSTFVLACGIVAGTAGLAYGVTAIESYIKARHYISRNAPMWLVAKSFTKISACCFVVAVILFLIYFFVLRSTTPAL